MRIAGLLSLALCVAMIGCSSTPTGGGSKTGSSLQTLADRLAAGRQQLQTTMTDLDTLTSVDEGDPAKQYQAYENSVKTLDKRAKEIQKSSNQIRNKSEAYFKKWEEEIASINNEDIKAQSGGRKQEVSDGIAKVRAEYDELGDMYTSLMSDLQDIASVVKNDLTVAGVKSIDSAAKRAQTEANKLLEKAGAVEAEFRKLGVELAGS